MTRIPNRTRYHIKRRKSCFRKYFSKNPIQNKPTKKETKIPIINVAALAAIKVLTLYTPLGCLVLFFPVWPALIAASLWYKFYQKQRVILQSKTCDSCKAVALQLLPNELATPLLSASEQMEHKLGSAIHRIYQCTSCGWLLRYKSITISEYRMCNQCHTIASKRISPWKTI